MRVLGWRVDGEFPNRAKMVLIAAPHSSNWDFVVGLAVKTALGIDVSWLGKHTLFRAPWGWLFRFWGGLPVDRRASNDTVASIVERFASRETLLLAIAPQGTRAKGAQWKTGFWHIAKGAGVPIVPFAFDWTNRVIVVMPALEPTDLASDMALIHSLYAPFRGRRG
jgi:1-acyl-sn-glycerol-3-phosphate acyltransferase